MWHATVEAAVCCRGAPATHHHHGCPRGRPFPPGSHWLALVSARPSWQVICLRSTFGWLDSEWTGLKPREPGPFHCLGGLDNTCNNKCGISAFTLDLHTTTLSRNECVKWKTSRVTSLNKCHLDWKTLYSISDRNISKWCSPVSCFVSEHLIFNTLI